MKRKLLITVLILLTSLIRAQENKISIGERDLAMKNFEKSLELNPGNTNATEQIKKLKAK